ncbi:MAG TPA: hypothetical protein PLM53_17570 [Spirochaetota bacterium]|nr:hypothetical protein [Spirochaetota bacterium]HPC41310.1 hypothetical protein [Spirochaetota bacterium]HPL17254.1 hypothetical protein [Spirochaetota bacterium]HQF09759.1 hypothetical protein [Spirochaetota bacterium]HQH98908.1 hypothetical protein [Spirochaetota bacterium]
MKKAHVLFALLAGLLAFTMAFGKADYGKTIVGTWSFDLGGGFMATVEFKGDGSLVQKMGDLTMAGTYKVEGDKLTTNVNGQVTVFTITSGDESSITMKRDKDGRIIVYKKN